MISCDLATVNPRLKLRFPPQLRLLLGLALSAAAHIAFGAVALTVSAVPEFDFELELPEDMELGLTEEMAAATTVPFEAPTAVEEVPGEPAAGAGSQAASESDAGVADAGVDAGVADAGAPDAGMDAGPRDAGSPDAGARDASMDAGERDGGFPDAGIDAGVTTEGNGAVAGEDDGSPGAFPRARSSPCASISFRFATPPCGAKSRRCSTPFLNGMRFSMARALTLSGTSTG